jgi:hypothetical protein
MDLREPPMKSRDILSTELPAPRDDEPPGLRQDILDELADHMACSYNRELLRGADPAAARRRAIERFGDPAAVARRLWLDAMKGKIMGQRTLIATCLIVTLASLSVAVVVLRQSAQAQRASLAAERAMRVMADQGEKSRISQQEMLKQLREMSETVRTTKSLEWNPVAFKVTEGSADGPPIEGVTVILTASASGSTTAVEVGERVTDRSGIADFGVVRPGHYLYKIARSWDQGTAVAFGQFKVEPGSRLDLKTACPKVPLERVPVRVRVTWPDDLAREKLALFATFTLDSIQSADVSWTISDVRPPDLPAGRRAPLRWLRQGNVPRLTRSVLCGPSAGLAEYRESGGGPYVWAPGGFPIHRLDAELSSDGLREIRDPSAGFGLEQGRYELNTLLIMRPGPEKENPAGKRRFDVVLGSQRYGNSSLWSAPPDDEKADGPVAKGAPASKRARRNLRGQPQRVISLNGVNTPFVYPWESWVEGGLAFEASPGHVNEWTIPLPEGLVKAVREQLKPRPKPAAGEVE